MDKEKFLKHIKEHTMFYDETKICELFNYNIEHFDLFIKYIKNIYGFDNGFCQFSLIKGVYDSFGFKMYLAGHYWDNFKKSIWKNLKIK